MTIIYILITRPFGLLLMFLYNLIGSYGLSIIAFTFIVRLLLLPLNVKSRRSTMAMSKIQPKLLELQAKYRNDKMKLNEEMQKLYQENNISPMSGCLPTLIQLPILIGLYGCIQKPLTFMMGLNTSNIQLIANKLGVEYAANNAQAEITLAGLIYENFEKVAHLSNEIAANLVPVDFHFLGFDLTATPSISHPSMLWILPILSGLTAFLSSFIMQKLQKPKPEPEPDDGKKKKKKKQQQPPKDPQSSSMKAMMVVMPLMSVYFGFMLPACLAVYWITGNILVIVQELILSKYFAWERKKQAAQVQSLAQTQKEK